MSYHISTYKRVKSIWGQIVHFSLATQPASTWFKTSAKAKPAYHRRQPLLQSPDSVHLRGAYKKNPQRKNPAP